MRCLNILFLGKHLNDFLVSGNRIRPTIEYAGIIYDNCPKYLADRLKGVQMEAVRICTGVMSIKTWLGTSY